MNLTRKTIAKHVWAAVCFAAAAKFSWNRFAGVKQRATWVDCALFAAAATRLVPIFRATCRIGYPALRTRIPDGLAFKCIALTFDNAPGPNSSERILDALRDAGAKATFFVALDRASVRPDLLRRIIADGHTLGIAGPTSEPMAHLNARQVEHAVKMVRRELGDQIPQANLFRPPLGWKSPAMRRAIKRMGMTQVAWSINPCAGRSADSLVRDVSARATHGNIVRLDDSPEVAEAIPAIVKRLQGRGFQLIRL